MNILTNKFPFSADIVRYEFPYLVAENKFCPADSIEEKLWNKANLAHYILENGEVAKPCFLKGSAEKVWNEVAEDPKKAINDYHRSSVSSAMKKLLPFFGYTLACSKVIGFTSLQKKFFFITVLTPFFVRLAARQFDSDRSFQYFRKIDYAVWNAVKFLGVSVVMLKIAAEKGVEVPWRVVIAVFTMLQVANKIESAIVGSTDFCPYSFANVYGLKTILTCENKINYFNLDLLIQLLLIALRCAYSVLDQAYRITKIMPKKVSRVPIAVQKIFECVINFNRPVESSPEDTAGGINAKTILLENRFLPESFLLYKQFCEVDDLRWLVSQKKITEEVLLECHLHLTQATTQTLVDNFFSKKSV